MFITFFNLIYKFFYYIGKIFFKNSYNGNSAGYNNRNSHNNNNCKNENKTSFKISSKKFSKRIISKIKNILFIDIDNNNEGLFKQLEKNNHLAINDYLDDDMVYEKYNDNFSNDFDNSVKYAIKKNNAVDNNQKLSIGKNYMNRLFNENLLETINIKAFIPILIIFFIFFIYLIIFFCLVLKLQLLLLSFY